MVALQGGARLLRAHDVPEARQTIQLFANTFSMAE
jgi:dihydropteroate synthase